MPTLEGWLSAGGGGVDLHAVRGATMSESSRGFSPWTSSHECFHGMMSVAVAKLSWWMASQTCALALRLLEMDGAVVAKGVEVVEQR